MAAMGALRRLWFIVLLAGFCLESGQALAGRRVALVIGNSAYENVTRLANPANDAELVADTLKGAGFDIVELRRDVKINDMRRVLRDFVDKSRDADVAVVYYAGHGIEVDGINYLIPVDAALERDVDVYDEAFSLDRILATIEPARQLRLVILDACRDNPFARTMKRTIASRTVGRGLAKVEPANSNTLIAFASKAGSTVADGDGKNSPFTTALVTHIAKPGLDLRRAFGYVRDDVLKATGNRQEPYVYGSLGGDDVPLVPANPAASPQPDPQVSVRRDYELALQAGDREAWEAFLRAYPDGFYADLAKVQLKKIAAEETRVAAVEKARVAERERARLAAEGARKIEQERAAAAAKAAEEARISAETSKQIEQEKAAAAERARAEAESAAAQKAATERMAAQKASEDKLAALSPPAGGTDQATVNYSGALQAELRRVGCYNGDADGDWNAGSQRALDLFNKYSGLKLEVKTAGADALDAVKGRTGRICPLTCEPGYRADGEHCVKIVCRRGYQPGDNGSCERIERKPTARHEEPRPQREPPDRANVDTVAKPQASGQVLCNQQGCRPIAKGCHMVTRGGIQGLNWVNGPSQSVEVCN
jgi:uncharacterized caspase-like protein